MKRAFFGLLLFLAFVSGILVSLAAGLVVGGGGQKEKDAPQYLLFVYGTLKSGERNHRFLSSSHRNRLVEKHAKVSGVFLRDMGQWPGMVYSGNANDIVQGEVWEIDTATKTMLDVLEGVGTPPQQTTAWPGFSTSPYRRQTLVWQGKVVHTYVLDARSFALDEYPKLPGGVWKGGPPLVPKDVV